MGNMDVLKEVVECQVIMEGKFEMRKGRMLSSSVFAKGGAKIYNIGSERTQPSDITVGTSFYLEQELLKVDNQIEDSQTALEKNCLEKNNIESRIATIIEKLANFDKSRQRTLRMMETMGQKTDNGYDETVELFKKNLAEADRTIHHLNDEQSLLEANIKKRKTISPSVQRL